MHMPCHLVGALVHGAEPTSWYLTKYCTYTYNILCVPHKLLIAYLQAVPHVTTTQLHA